MAFRIINSFENLNDTEKKSIQQSLKPLEMPYSFSVPLIIYASGVKGYFTGGNYSVKVVDLFTFSTETNGVKASATLNTNHYDHTAVSAGMIIGKGYIFFGEFSVMERITYTTDTTANLGIPTGATRAGMASISERVTKAYILGGDHVNYTSILIFNTELCSLVSSAYLSRARVRPAGMSEGSTKGYIGGGWDDGELNTIDKTVFANDTTSLLASPRLTNSKYSLGGISNSVTQGYFSGGTPYTSVTDKMTFATDTCSYIPSANLSLARYGVGAMSQGTSYGYFGGGYNVTNPPTNIIDRVIYSTDTTALLGSAVLSSVNYNLAAMSDFAV